MTPPWGSPSGYSAGREVEVKRAVVAAVVAVALALPAAVEAAGTPCGSLTDGHWKATDIRATHLTCRSARTKLRRWLPPPLPANPIGWNCFRFRGRRMCAVGQGDAPRFTFRLRRVRGRRPSGAGRGGGQCPTPAGPSRTCLSSTGHGTRAPTSSAYAPWASGAGARAALRIGRP
jgi:hypothetical protein